MFPTLATFIFTFKNFLNSFLQLDKSLFLNFGKKGVWCVYLKFFQLTVLPYLKPCLTTFYKPISNHPRRRSAPTPAHKPPSLVHSRTKHQQITRTHPLTQCDNKGLNDIGFFVFVRFVLNRRRDKHNFSLFSQSRSDALCDYAVY